MKVIKITSVAITTLIIAACSSRKKSSTPITSPAPVVATTTTSTTTPTNTFLVTRSAGGIYAPGNEELTAIRTQYNDVTLDKLKEGYRIYAEGACVKCHRAFNIYPASEAKWKNIIEDMALRANLSDPEKDAVYKYVLAIKTTQPK